MVRLERSHSSLAMVCYRRSAGRPGCRIAPRIAAMLAGEKPMPQRRIWPGRAAHCRTLRTVRQNGRDRRRPRSGHGPVGKAGGRLRRTARRSAMIRAQGQNPMQPRFTRAAPSRAHEPRDQFNMQREQELVYWGHRPHGKAGAGQDGGVAGEAGGVAGDIGEARRLSRPPAPLHLRFGARRAAGPAPRRRRLSAPAASAAA